MRAAITVMASLVVMPMSLALMASCSKDHGGAAEARKEAEEQAKKEAAAGLPPTVKAPVAEGVHLPCDGLLDVAKFTEELGELLPVAFQDQWNANKDTAAACSVRRGGIPPTTAEQTAMLKKQPRLGVLPGDEICYVQAVCSRLETPDHFRSQCVPKGLQVEEGFETAACRQIVQIGPDDVQVFHIFDADSTCVLKVGAGPSNVDNELTRKCAKAAMAALTPESVKITPVPKDAPPGTGSTPVAGSGSDAGSAAAAVK